MRKTTFQIGLALATSLLALSLPLYLVFWVHPHFNDIIAFEKEVDAEQITRHIAKMLVMDERNKVLTRESITDNFVAVLQEAQADFDLAKIKVFSAAGEVVYSTEEKDIGTVNTNPYFTDIVAEGKIFSKIVRRNEKTMEDKTIRKDVVETYVPLLRDGRFIGAFEVYYDITYIEHLRSKFAAQTHIIIIILAVFLLLCVLAITLSFIKCYGKLHRTEEKMSRLKEEMPILFGMSGSEENE